MATVEKRRKLAAGGGLREALLADLPVTERRLEVAGIATAVLEGGEETPVVLLHGPGEFAATWLRVIPELEATHRVVAPDLPGHGASGLPAGPLDAERALAWLGELIERTCDSPPALVGHLLGGSLAARFAVDNGSKISRFVLVDGYGLAPLRPAPSFALGLIGFMARPTERSQRRLMRACMNDLQTLRERMDGRLEELEAYALDRARTPAMKKALRTLMPQLGMRPIPAADLGRITVPTTLIWGRHALQVRLRVAEAASARYGWPLHVIEDAADDPAVEQPEAFLDALEAALAGFDDREQGGSMTTMEQTRGAWDSIATGYDRFVTPTHIGLGDEAVKRAGVGPGKRFLDVAAGSGALSIPAGRLGAQVVAIDISPTMVERLAARAAEEGLADVEAQVMDGHALDFEDDTFDVSGSQFGVMLFPDLPRAVGEMARVTKPGGRVLLVVFGPPAQVEFLGFFIGAIQAVVPGFTGLPLDPPPLPFQVADPEKLRQALANAGLEDVSVETTTETLEFESGEQMWDWVVNSNPIGAMLVADLTAEQGAQVRERLNGMLRERSGGSGPAVLTNAIHIGIGTS